MGIFNKKEKDKIEEQIDDIEKVVLGEEKTLKEDYELFLEERKNLLPLSEDERNLIEAEIRLGLLNMWKKAKEGAMSDDPEAGWFRYEDIYKIPYIDDYFNILTANGDRNIGKSRSSQRIVRDTVSSGKRFMWIRNIDDEVEAQLISDTAEEGWLTKNGWGYEGKSKSPTIVNLVTEEEIGWYRPLNTAAKFKSVDFPNTELIVYEEFNEKPVSHQFYKFVKMVSTIQRHQPKVRVILQSNYVDQWNDMLQSLGIGSKKLTIRDFVVFNWEIGAIIINIPRGIYRQPKNELQDVAKRASLGKYDVWKGQYGGGFANEEPVNIIDERDFVAIEPQFNIFYDKPESVTGAKNVYGSFKMTLYKVWLRDGSWHNVLTETRGANDKPIFIYDHLNHILYPDAILMSIETLEGLIMHWKNNNLKTTEVKTHAKIVKLFATASKILAKDENLITVIENLV